MILLNSEEFKTEAALLKRMLKQDPSRKLLIYFSLYILHEILILTKKRTSLIDTPEGVNKSIIIIQDLLSNKISMAEAKGKFYKEVPVTFDSYQSVNYYISISLTDIFRIVRAIKCLHYSFTDMIYKKYADVNLFLKKLDNGEISNLKITPSEKEDLKEYEFRTQVMLLNRWLISMQTNLYNLLQKRIIFTGKYFLSKIDKKPINLSQRNRITDILKEDDVYCLITYLNDEEIIGNLLETLSDYIDNLNIIGNAKLDSFVLKDVQESDFPSDKLEKVLDYVKLHPSMKVLLQFWVNQL